jgi:hypothetical protein
LGEAGRSPPGKAEFGDFDDVEFAAVSGCWAVEGRETDKAIAKEARIRKRGAATRLKLLIQVCIFRSNNIFLTLSARC